MHVPQLKSFRGVLPAHPYILAWLQNTRADVVLISYKILARRVVKKQNRPAVQYLVQWDSQAEEQATWILADDFEKQYPDFPT